MEELEHAIQRASRDKRAATVRRITDFFLLGAESFSDEQIALFDDVVLRLIDDIESRVLAELAGRLAPVDRAPVKVIRRLARSDEIVVAGPVLAKSNRLNVADLIEIAKTKGQRHLLAISVRPRLDAALTSILVDRGNDEVLCNVAGNSGASFSDSGFAILVGRAEGDDRLTEKVGLRPDIPAHLLERLLLRATKVAQDRLLRSARPDVHPEIRQLLARIAREFGVGEQMRDYEAARRAVASRRRAGALGESDILEFAKANRSDELVIALSELCSVSVDVIDRLMDIDRCDAMLIPCRSAGLEWSTVREIVRLHARGRPISDEGYRRSQESFDKLTKMTANRILRFWESRRRSAMH